MDETEQTTTRTLDEEIGRRVRVARMGVPMSQQELAENMTDAGGKPWYQGTVTAVETGKRPLRFSEAIELADLLGISLDSLAGRPSVEEDALRRRAVRAEDRLQRAYQALRGIYDEQDLLTQPWED
jgi:transcriptional regulator with XRE-family HTH domain